VCDHSAGTGTAAHWQLRDTRAARAFAHADLILPAEVHLLAGHADVAETESASMSDVLARVAVPPAAGVPAALDVIAIYRFVGRGSCAGACNRVYGLATMRLWNL
jgi:hypothetical protein